MIQFREVPTDSLVGYVRNPRKNDAVVGRMVESIKEFGFRIPIVAKSDGSVVDGHLRLKAALKLGLESVPVIIADDLSEAQIKAFRLLANRSANWAEWDYDMLSVELDELKDMGFDLDMIGFDVSELARMIDEDEPKELKEESYSEVFNVIVECASEQEQEKLFNKLDSEGYKCRVQSL